MTSLFSIVSLLTDMIEFGDRDVRRDCRNFAKGGSDDVESFASTLDTSIGAAFQSEWAGSALALFRRLAKDDGVSEEAALAQSLQFYVTYIETRLRSNTWAPQSSNQWSNAIACIQRESACAARERFAQFLTGLDVAHWAVTGHLRDEASVSWSFSDCTKDDALQLFRDEINDVSEQVTQQEKGVFIDSVFKSDSPIELI